MRVGVDTGGTFTDCVLVAGGKMKVVKVFSGSPASPELATQAIIDGVRQVLEDEAGGPLEIIHGTTLSTNSLLERRGARVALVTTRGFEDLIEIGRQTRPQLYNLNVRREPPLVPRALRYGLKERTAAGGKVLLRPSEREVQRLRRWLRKSKAESVALCLLFSFANPSTERQVLNALRPLGIPISASHEILPEFREYERLSAVAINAFLMPRVGAYLSLLERKASMERRDDARHPQSKVSSTSSAGLRFKVESLPSKSHSTNAKHVRVFVMESSGGITTAAHAAREPVRTILSGPAGGVAAAAALMARLGIRQAITFDMGGTSTDVCLLDGKPPLTNETTIGDLPVAVPVVDVRSVGAGGGSLIRIDAGGALRVGPESAGATPGPVCYGRGGRRLTVTDANLVLGRLDPEHFLGGTFRLDVEAAGRQFDQFLHRQGGGRAFANPVELARGIVGVANSNMESALRVISVERGYDPRDFTLISFGGAGGLHCADLGRALGVRKAIVPLNPGTFSALGVLLSDMVKDASRSVLLPVPDERPRGKAVAFGRFLRDLDARFRRMEAESRAGIRRDRFPSGKVGVERQVDVRYVGQAYELTVPFSPRFPEDFKRLHERTYGYAHECQPLEVVNLRLRLTVATLKPGLRRGGRAGAAGARRAIVNRRRVWFDHRSSFAPIYERELLPDGTRFRGPAVVAEYSSTTFVPPDYVCSVDAQGNLVLTQHAH